ncbi:MAG: histidinol-phosphate transaminase [Clostridiales bacterium]|nr:histidinol-phosphate transaminase [Clostridiales bacterium]
MKWEENVRKVEPYVPGEQPQKVNVIKLNTNECPYPPAPGVRDKLQRLSTDRFRLYPDTSAGALAQALCEYYKISTEQLFIGVGSDDVLSMAFLTFFNSNKPVFFPDITYSFYDVWAQLYRIPYETKALDDDLRIKKEDYLAANGGIVIPNPNAPTGVFEDVDIMEEIIAANRDSVVIIDEAYVDFGGESCLKLIDKYDNLLVVQTFSKSRAMAGMRIGFAMGNPKLIGYLQDAKFSFNSYTMNTPSIELGAEAVKDAEYFKETIEKIVSTRERTKLKLKELGFSFPDSKGNFIFATHERIPAKEIFEALKEKNIFVRFWDKPRIGNYLRISIGTDEEMDILVENLKGMVK